MKELNQLDIELCESAIEIEALSHLHELLNSAIDG